MLPRPISDRTLQAFTSVVKLVCVFVLYQKPKFDKATLQVTSRVRRIFILRGRVQGEEAKVTDQNFNVPNGNTY